jgi:hypothetical protein
MKSPASAGLFYVTIPADDYVGNLHWRSKRNSRILSGSCPEPRVTFPCAAIERIYLVLFASLVFVVMRSR